MGVCTNGNPQAVMLHGVREVTSTHQALCDAADHEEELLLVASVQYYCMTTFKAKLFCFALCCFWHSLPFARHRDTCIVTSLVWIVQFPLLAVLNSDYIDTQK